MNPAEKFASAAGPAGAVVIGGGIVGLACAIGLQRRGHHTVLFDPAMLPRPASWGNAGHIATEQVEPLASLATLAGLPRRLFARGGAAAFPLRDIGAWLPFGWRLLRASGPARFEAGKRALKSLLAESLPAWRRLSAATASETLLADDGHYVIWETAASARAGREHWARADTGTATVRDLESRELAHFARLVACQPAGGLKFSGTGRVLDPGELLDSLARAFTAAGGELRREPIARLHARGSQAVLHLSTGETMTPGLVLVAAGVGSPGLLGDFGYRVPLIAERGYHLQAGLQAGSQAAEWPDMPVVFEQRSMIVSRFNSGLRAASFVEFGRAGSPPDPRKWRRLRAHARDLRLPWAGEPAEWMGARPTFPDYLPAIGRSRRAENLLYAFGHQHLGLTLAAITGELVGSIASGHAPPIDLRPFDLERFS
jgi:glycine/D-amino acid oxidase-like deaminating enzyme